MLLPGRGGAPFLFFLLPKAAFNICPLFQAVLKRLKCCLAIRDLADNLIRALPRASDPLLFEAIQFLQCQSEGCEEQFYFHLTRPDDLVLQPLFGCTAVRRGSTLLSCLLYTSDAADE